MPDDPYKPGTVVRDPSSGRRFRVERHRVEDGIAYVIGRVLDGRYAGELQSCAFGADGAWLGSASWGTARDEDALRTWSRNITSALAAQKGASDA